MRRLGFLVLILSSACSRPAEPPSSTKPVNVVETPIAELRQAMEEGRTTSRAIVQQYLTRIALYEDRFNATLAVNPDALTEADARDRERAAGTIRGPLHGIPIALKDNIHTTNMPTTGGAVAFEGLMVPYDATITRLLREAGAIIIAKTTLTELANWVAGGPTPMPGNYNGLSGYALNPYDPRRDPREQTGDGRPVLNTGGSSSGAGTADEFLGGQRRHRDIGVDPEPGESEHAGRHQADRRSYKPLRRHPDHRGSGHGRADGQVRRRCRYPPRCARSGIT